MFLRVGAGVASVAVLGGRAALAPSIPETALIDDDGEVLADDDGEILTAEN